MFIRCPKCKKEYDATLFEFKRTIKCECGNILDLQHEEVFEQLKEVCRKYDLTLEEENVLRIKRASEKIASLILNTDYPQVDVEIEKMKFRQLIRSIFPDKIHLYDLIYEPRFKRFWEQFRKTE